MFGAFECKPLSTAALLWRFQMVKYPKCFNAAPLLPKQFQNTYVQKQVKYPWSDNTSPHKQVYSCVYEP